MIIRLFIAAALWIPAIVSVAQDDHSLRVTVHAQNEQVVVDRGINTDPLVQLIAKSNQRPYLNPLVAADGDISPTHSIGGHAPHQIGLVWTYHESTASKPDADQDSTSWHRVGLSILKATSDQQDPSVSWQAIYDHLGDDDQSILRETQTWTVREYQDHYRIDFHCKLLAERDSESPVPNPRGLSLRVGERSNDQIKIVNSARQKDQHADGQRSVWLDLELKHPGRQRSQHFSIFDHPANAGFPSVWQIDPQNGIGPSLSDGIGTKLSQGDAVSLRYRILVHTGELDDVWLTDQWSKFSGQRLAWAQWNVARREGREANFLTPEKAVKTMTLEPDFTANVFAAEPMISQPMAFCWDDRGRLWIAENRDYETRQTGFSADGKSRILILEDTNRDGVADSRKVFLEGIPFPAAIAIGMGGLWLGAPPNLMFVPDHDGDDHADVDDIEIRLTGWGIRDRHETLNSLIWGPDGWLYGCQGFATPSQVGKPKNGGKIYRRGEAFPEQFEFDGDAVEINGGVWRYHPSKDRFEVVAHGFSNPWGLDYDAHGQLFITACVIPHLWHVIPGGIYHRQGGQHYNPHVYSDIQTIADHRHRSAHGGARVYLSDAFPDKYKHRIFMANIHEHAVLTDILEPKGSGFIGHHGDDFALANNAQWIGFSIEIGPDGNVYVLDWHDADICGKEVLQKETGRIFRFSHKQSLANDFTHRYVDLSLLKDIDLVRLQEVESAWHARRGRLVLQHRATLGPIDDVAADELRRMLHSSSSPAIRLRALWSMHVTATIDQSTLKKLLGDSDEYVRGWAVQLLCEDRQPDVETEQQIIKMAAADRSPVVRLYLASAAQRIDPGAAILLLENLSLHEEDAVDHNLPKMIWFALEPWVVPNRQRALRLAAQAKIPLISRYIARRVAAEDQLEPLVEAIGLCEHSDRRLQMLLGMRDALEGRFDLSSPRGWGDVYQQLRASGGQTARIALQLSGQFGDRVAAEAMLTTVTNPNAERADRLQALRSLAGRRREELKPRLVPLLDDETIRRAALRAAAVFDDPKLAKQILIRYPKFSDTDKVEAINTLASRSSYANQLTDAIERHEISKSEIPAYIARTLRRVVGNRFTDVWGPIDAVDHTIDRQFDRYRQLVTPPALEQGNASAGRLIFNRTCAACHKLYGYGGVVGPDITGANRSNMEYLLSNILTPSAIIQDAYKMHIVLTDDGRIYSGIPAEENERQLMLRVADRDQPIVIAQSQIESQEIAPVSMMPTGMLENLGDQEVIDLLKYLQTERQVALPSGN